MRINWRNIIVLFLLVLVIVLIVKSHLVEVFSQSIETLRYHQGSPSYGLVGLAIICITILATFVIISNRKH